MRVPYTAVAAMLVATLGVSAQEHQHAGGELGTVTFPTSCNAAAQTHMHRAVAMLHSFWFPEARKTFEAAATADPSCGIAYWGVAMSYFGNPMAGGSTGQSQVAGWEAAQKGQQAGARSDRDRAYIEAAAALFRDYDKVDARTRMGRHEAALRSIVQKYPDDTEAKIFHGIYMVATAPPTDLTFAQQKKAADILIPLYKQMPKHPGLAHYIIHAFDAPPLADRALEAARVYADIAPAAPHALHMPSHIFTRLGYWDESIKTNRRSADLEPTGAKAHAADYMVYAFLQQGRDEQALKVMEEVGGNARGEYTAIGALGSYNAFAMPARFALERDDWKSAAALKVTTAPPSAEAVTHFARGLGAARNGDVATAKQEIGALEKAVADLTAAKDAYWPIVVDAQRMAIEAWVAHAEGRHAEALQLAKAAADKEETVEKHPVTPGPLIPARELLGDILMVHKQPDAALAAYEATLKREPNRARTLLGAARAARSAGKNDVAKKYYKALVDVMDPQSMRPELKEAKEAGFEN
jgi:tetratricopeptide (TPR) repeat protein